MSRFLQTRFLPLFSYGFLGDSQGYAFKDNMDYSSDLAHRGVMLRSALASSRIRCLSRHRSIKGLWLELSNRRCGNCSGLLSRLRYHERDYQLRLHGWW